LIRVSSIRVISGIRGLGVSPKVVGLAPDELVVRERSDLPRFDQNYVVRVLDFPFDHKKIFFGD
jgi:hypothetical protein